MEGYLVTFQLLIISALLFKQRLSPLAKKLSSNFFCIPSTSPPAFLKYSSLQFFSSTIFAQFLSTSTIHSHQISGQFSNTTISLICWLMMSLPLAPGCLVYCEMQYMWPKRQSDYKHTGHYSMLQKIQKSMQDWQARRDWLNYLTSEQERRLLEDRMNVIQGLEDFVPGKVTFSMMDWFNSLKSCKVLISLQPSAQLIIIAGISTLYPQPLSVIVCYYTNGSLLTTIIILAPNFWTFKALFTNLQFPRGTRMKQSSLKSDSSGVWVELH